MLYDHGWWCQRCRVSATDALAYMRTPLSTLTCVRVHATKSDGCISPLRIHQPTDLIIHVVAYVYGMQEESLTRIKVEVVDLNACV